jgi:uncharacterized protein with ATP-grasp and redox domains
MKTALECIPCFVRQAVEAVELCTGDRRERERLVRRLLREIADTDWAVMPVVIAQRLQRIVREETGQADPYRLLKDRMNRMALDLLPALTEVSECHRDAGEIVFDRLLIEALPTEKITVAVRGGPVLNDATLVDADTAGIPESAPVIANGSDAPGTLVGECSEEFRYWFDRADLIIAKGQGNYETLSDTTKAVFFLLAVKCPLIAAEIGAPVGALVAKRGREIESA